MVGGGGGGGHSVRAGSDRCCQPDNTARPRPDRSCLLSAAEGAPGPRGPAARAGGVIAAWHQGYLADGWRMCWLTTVLSQLNTGNLVKRKEGGGVVVGVWVTVTIATPLSGQRRTGELSMCISPGYSQALWSTAACYWHRERAPRVQTWNSLTERDFREWVS